MGHITSGDEIDHVLSQWWPMRLESTVATEGGNMSNPKEQKLARRVLARSKSQK